MMMIHNNFFSTTTTVVVLFWSMTCSPASAQPPTTTRLLTQAMVNVTKNDPFASSVDNLLQKGYWEATKNKDKNTGGASAKLPPMFDPMLQVNYQEEEAMTLALLALQDGVSELDIETTLKDMGASVVACGPYSCTCWIPMKKIKEVSQLDAVKFMRAEARSVQQQGSVKNEAFVAHQVDELRQKFPNLTGAGLKIGVLSDSYDTSLSAVTDARDDIASGDLPNDVTVLRDLPPLNDQIDEGRAMLQLIHDIAPDAKLFFRTAFIGAQDFANGIGELADAGCDVIVDDVTYFAQPYFSDGVIAQAASRVAQRGIPYFSSAGNKGTQSYEADFVASSESFTLEDGKQCLLHQFGPKPTDYLQLIDAPEGGRIFLQWTDPFATVAGPPGAAYDIDMYVFDTDFGLLDSSLQNNVGNDPIEFVSLLPGGQYFVAICAVGATTAPPVRLKWINFGPDLADISPDTKSSTCFGHANARDTAGVGAAAFSATPAYGQSPPLPETFTSRGGTQIYFDEKGMPLKKPELRLQPRFTAVDGVSTTFFGSQNRFFFGTSAAAPNCAAIALLLKQFDPDLNPNEVYTALASTAIDMGTPGFDFDTGAGLVGALAALNSLKSAPSVAPVAAPVAVPSAAPTAMPVPAPTAAPTVVPTAMPVPAPTAAPTVAPTVVPVPAPSAAPVAKPIASPTKPSPLAEKFRRFSKEYSRDSHRHLIESNDCFNAEYDMYLVNAHGAHFAGLATPKDGSNKNCPSMAFHAQVDEDSHQLQKTAVVVSIDDVLELDEEDKLYLGSNALVEIFHAFEAAPASRDGVLYDAIGNNCVVLLRNMADHLDIAVDQRIVGFVTNKLTSRASSHVVDMMRKSPTLRTLYAGSRRMLGSVSSEDLVAKVIQLYV